MSPLRLDNESTDPDARIANLLAAVSRDDSPEADVARWALRNLQNHRAALKAIRDRSNPHVIHQLAREGLTLIED